MKIAVIGDAHFGIKKSDKTFLQSQLRFFEDQLVPELKSRNIKNLFVLGDVFDTRQSVNVQTDNIVLKLFKETLKDFTCQIIVGNHDIYHTTTTEVIDAPPPEKKAEYSNKNTLYWKYLNTPLSSVDFSDLTKQNKDTVAWIIVKNTNVNYPVVQTSDNDYYLKHSFNRKSNSAGWVFADYRDDLKDFNQNMIIYAHGRKDKVMFGSLTNTLKKNWYTNQDNQIIQLSTPDYNTMWQIFSIYKVQAESYYITTDFYSDESYQKFIDTMKSRSIYDFGVDVTTKDKLLTLSTCYNDKGIRLVVQAKLVKIQER